jgi:hypothetical protein
VAQDHGAAERAEDNFESDCPRERRILRAEDIRRYRTLEGEAERIDLNSVVDPFWEDVPALIEQGAFGLPLDVGMLKCVAFVSTEGGILAKLLALMLSLQLCLAGCAIRGVGGANQRGERLAIERGKLSETTNPIARTKSYIVISDLLLSFASDAVREQAHDDVVNLLNEYVRTIRTAQETIVNSERPPARQPLGYTELEVALRRQVKTLQDLRTKVDAADQGTVDQVVQVAASIREELSNMVSRSAIEN